MTAISVDPAAPSASSRSTVYEPVRHRNPRRRNDLIAYLSSAVGGFGAAFISMQLWLANLAIPFFYSGDAVSSAAHVKATVQWGWYENQPDLGAPAGQVYHDYPFGDNLPLMFAKVAGWFTSSWPVVFNLYYLLGFPLAAVAALWFLRRCGVSRPLAVALSVLWAVAPYHWLRGEDHYYLAGYWVLPIGMWVALEVLRGRPVWGRRSVGDAAGIGRRALSWFAGRGALVAVGLAVLATSAAYYAVFVALLIGFSGLVALVRTHSWRRFFGAAIAGGLLIFVVVLNVLPDIIYESSHGTNTTGFSRGPADAETYALKLTSLVLPAPGHQIPALARLRTLYDTKFPLPSEQPALGLVGAVGLALALLIAFYAMTRGLRSASAEQRTLSARMSMLLALAALTLLMLLLSTVGGLGTVLAFISSSLRGWNRMSILIALACLTIVGVVADASLIKAFGRRSQRRRGRVLSRAVIAVIITGVGVFDQSIARAIPPYSQVDAVWASDEQFVTRVEAVAGANAMLFQTPAIAFPESLPSVATTDNSTKSPVVHQMDELLDSDAVRLSLHSTTLRWSNGGIKGRPQSDWPAMVSKLPPNRIIVIAALMGFVGVVVDGRATPDAGAALLSAFAQELGPPSVESADRRWHYFPLTVPRKQMEARTTVEERGAFVRRMLTDPQGAIDQAIA